MSYVKEKNVRASAVQYMRGQLGQGKSLAKTLLETVDFGEGDIIALSPTPLSSTETIQFDSGHTPQTHVKPERIKFGDRTHLAVPTPNANQQLAAMIYDALGNLQSVCFLENFLAEAHDGWLERAKSRIVTNGNEVYHALFSLDRCDKDKIEVAIREWHYLPTSIGAFGNMDDEASAYITSEKTITKGQLTAFARTVQSVFVSAYDGEGCLVWNKPPK